MKVVMEHELPLKKDGNLYIECINSLPLEEYMEVMGDLSQDQVKEFLSRLPIDVPGEPMRAIPVDYTLEEDISLRGSVLIEDFIKQAKEEALYRMKEK